MSQLKSFSETYQGVYSHHSLPLVLIRPDEIVAWRAEYDEWGNRLREDNPYNLAQLIRLPGSNGIKRQGCTITATGITTRHREGISRRTQSGRKRYGNLYSYTLNTAGVIVNKYQDFVSDKLDEHK